MTIENLDGPLLNGVESVIPEATGTIPQPVDEKEELRSFIAKQFEPKGDNTPLRNEQGKFTKAEGAEASDTPAPIPDAGESQGKVEERSTALEPPKGWSADAKAKWAVLDPSIQAEVMKREQDMDNGGRQWSEQRKSYDEMLTPVRSLAERSGVNEREAITRLVEASEWLERDPAGFIEAYAQHYGINLGNNPTQQTQGRPDPVLSQVTQELSQIKQTLSKREEAEVQSQIQSFASAPGHEHFEKVRLDMGKLITADPSLSMDDAYERAIWANKDIRTELIKQQQASAQKQTDAAQVAKAKNAAASPKGSGPSASPPIPKKDYGDDTRKLVEDLYYGRAQ